MIPSPWIIVAAILAALACFGGGYYRGDHEGSDRVQVAWDHSKLLADQEHEKEVERIHQETAALQQAADEDRKKLNAKLKDRNSQLDAALGELRERPERPDPIAAFASPGPERGACNGAGLYRDDAELLTRLADTAQRIREQRDDFREKYERAREALSKPSGGG